ncbi:cation transporter [Staphylococcus capitis]
MISNSDMVLLDGLYSVISLVISSLSLFTSYMIKKPNRDSFPFGKYIFQPLTIVFNSSILLLCILSLISSANAILNNGRIINANIGLGYGIFSFLGCGLIYLILFKNKSDLIYTEKLQWLLDTCVSFELIIGFAIIFVVKCTSFSWFIPYIDPVLVLMAGVILIFMPIRLLFNNFKEIISMSASDEIQYNLHETIKEMNAKYYIKEEDLRITKIGQMIYIDLQNTVDNTSKIQTIKQAYKYRNEVIEIINKDFNNFDKWLNISFTKQFYSKQIN